MYDFFKPNYMFAQLYIIKWYCNTFKTVLGICKNCFLFIKDPDIIQFGRKLFQTLSTHEHIWAGLEIGKDRRVFLERGTVWGRVSMGKHVQCAERDKGSSWETWKGRADTKPQRFLIAKVINMVIFCNYYILLSSYC